MRLKVIRKRRKQVAEKKERKTEREESLTQSLTLDSRLLLCRFVLSLPSTLASSSSSDAIIIIIIDGKSNSIFGGLFDLDSCYFSCFCRRKFLFKSLSYSSSHMIPKMMPIEFLTFRRHFQRKERQRKERRKDYRRIEIDSTASDTHLT